MTLKDEILSDIDNVFLDFEDFATFHMIDNKKVLCIIDAEELKTRQGTNELNVSECDLIIFGKTSDFPARKSIGDYMNIDGTIYVIEDWKENLGMSEIAFSKLSSRGSE